MRAEQFLTVRTEGELDDIRVVSSSIADDQMEAMLGAQSYVHAIDQLGRVIEMSFDLGGDDLGVDALTAAPIRRDLMGELEGDPVSYKERLDAAAASIYCDFTEDQKDLLEQLEFGCGLTRTQGVTLVDGLSSLGASRRALRASTVNEDQSDQLRTVEKAIESRINELVLAVPGIQGVDFLGDPAGETIVVTFGGGAQDGFNGDWKVPVNPLDEGVLPQASWIVLDIDDTGNAAFVDVGRELEVARIIADAAEKIRNAEVGYDISMMLMDINGNKVGRLCKTDVAPTETLKPGAVRLVIDDTDCVLSRPNHHENLAQLLELVSTSVQAGRRSFTIRTEIPGVIGFGSSSASFEFSDTPTPVQNGRMNMEVALRGNIYMADGVEEGEYRYLIPKGDFEIGYHWDYGDVWLVNAKGEIALGYEDTQSVRENCMRDLKADERRALTDVVQHRVSFEDHERSLGNEDYLDEAPEV